MACEHVKIPAHEGVMIVCGGRSRVRYCVQCGRPADLECDWKVAARKSGTCDRPVCKVHALEVGPDKHLCPEHQRAYDSWKRRRWAEGLPPDPLGSQQLGLFPGPVS